MRNMEINGDAGQVLVQVALMVVVLFGFLALALDGGHFFAERRHMQNAADAGALAGAREICFGNDPTEAEVETKAREYAIDRNGAQDAEVEVQSNLTVSVIASETINTFFAGVIGIGTMDVQAEAAAVCGKSVAACNVWPMAFDAATFDKEECGEHIILWEDGRADCGTYSCTCTPGSGAVPAADGRTWIDFSAVLDDGGEDPCDQTGCGNSELRDRIEGEDNRGDDCRSYIEIPSCTAGDSGVKSSSWDTAGDEIGETKIIPLYDQDLSPCTMDKDPGNSCGTERWWIRDLGCVTVRGSCRLCEQGETPPCNGPKVIDVTIECSPTLCSTACGATWGEVPGPGDPTSVSLVR